MWDHGARANTFTFARATPSDLLTITEMFERCSVNSRRRRFFRPLPSAPPGYLEEVLANSDRHHAFVVKHDQKTVGFAELHRVGPRSGSLALIIEDVYQHRGAGSAALRVLVRHSRKIGLRTLTADVLFENTAILHALRRVGPVSVNMEDGIFHIEIDLESAGLTLADPPRVSGPRRQTECSRDRRTNDQLHVAGS
jgi:RimJ/RimL family protein N-acetyltransferase